MPTKSTTNPDDFIIPLNINGLRGRMLRMPAPKGKDKEILVIYGHHASIERLHGLALDLNRYGAVTMPDLPGFGGMDSFYSIGEKPTLDNLADYMATFIKLRYKKKRITIMAMSMGMLITTRMLQKYPEIAKKVDVLVSTVGFVHKDDFRFKKRDYLLLRITASIFSNWLPAMLCKHFVLRDRIIRFIYNQQSNTHSKLKDADEDETRRRIDFEIVLWKCNDIRTYMDTSISMLTANLCDKQVDLPIYHVSVKNDRYFDNNIVEQHLKIIYSDVIIFESAVSAHAPTVVATIEDIAPFMPPKLRRILAKS